VEGRLSAVQADVEISRRLTHQSAGGRTRGRVDLDLEAAKTCSDIIGDRLRVRNRVRRVIEDSLSGAEHLVPCGVTARAALRIVRIHETPKEIQTVANVFNGMPRA